MEKFIPRQPKVSTNCQPDSLSGREWNVDWEIKEINNLQTKVKIKMYIL